MYDNLKIIKNKSQKALFNVENCDIMTYKYYYFGRKNVMKNPFVFISYSTKDSDVANLVHSYLEGNGIPCWIASRNIEGGESFAVQIVDAINDCSAFVMICIRENL